ncbi:hypothetical protein [Mumia sp. Pv 4-285]|uniref:hypothetical protein n=1 Tax=Mumia qirimensis TaxID=3234852 RepID=UPI00351CE97C
MDDMRTALATPIRCQQDLHDRWSILMGELGFSRRSLWFTFVDTERRMIPQISEIVDLSDRGDHEMASELLTMCRRLLDEADGVSSVAFLVSRPGHHRMDPDDRSWARALTAAARFQRVPIETVHLATDSSLVAFAPDDLAA